MIEYSMGVMAFNEDANIGRLLDALLSQNPVTAVLRKILVVASGCTDRTKEIVGSYARRDPRVLLLHQAKREGKAAAVNAMLRQPGRLL